MGALAKGGGNRHDHLCLKTIKCLKANIEYVLARDYYRPVFLISGYEKYVQRKVYMLVEICGGKHTMTPCVHIEMQLKLVFSRS